MEVEHVFFALFLACVASIPLILWNGQSLLFSPLISLLREMLSVLKLFGMALLLILSLIIGIAIWECLNNNIALWKNPVTVPTAASITTGGNPSQSQSGSPTRNRSIVPVVFLVAGLSLVAALDMSFFFPASNLTPSTSPPRAPSSSRSNANSLAFQFSIALLALGLVVAFVVFNKDEYRAWKARRRLYKSNRRRARQEASASKIRTR